MTRVLAVALLLVGCGTTWAAPPATVLVVSIDALHPDALTAKAMPHVRRAMERGQYTLQGRSTNPPKTLVAHTAMVTGLPPERSGKTDNAWAPGDPTVKLRTLFHVAKDAGYRTAFFYGRRSSATSRTLRSTCTRSRPTTASRAPVASFGSSARRSSSCT